MKVLAHEEDALEDPYRKEVLEIKRRYYEIARGIFDELRREGQVARINPRVAVLSLFGIDRKSTRLNSSHSQISYAVFCLKKKKRREARRHGVSVSLDRSFQS